MWNSVLYAAMCKKKGGGVKENIYVFSLPIKASLRDT